MATSAVAVVLIAYRALSAEEREHAFERIEQVRLEETVAEGSATARLIRSLVRAAEELGRQPTVDDYKQVRRLLNERGEEIAPLSQVICHFGSWRRAREALTLKETTTSRRIEALFRSRRLGKIWRYRDETLAETLGRCVAELGHIPQVAEFEWWRQRQLELAAAEGNDALHLPTASPYRRRWGSWQQALLQLGYAEKSVAARLERP